MYILKGIFPFKPLIYTVSFMSADFLQKDVVYVNSGKRINPLETNSNNFSIDLSQQITKGNDYDTVSLLNFSCPKSYYIFNSVNNVFAVSENGVSSTITIPVGNYDVDTLATQLVTLFTASLSYTYTVTVSNTTGKYSFNVSNNVGVQPIFDFDVNYSAYKVLGFNKTSYQFAGDILVSPNIVNLQISNTIQLCCNFVERSVLSIIIPNTGDFSSIDYVEYNPNFTSHRLIITELTNATFSLLDGNTGYYIDLNGLDYSFAFVIYKKNSYYQNMIEDRKLELMIKDLEEQVNDLEKQRKEKVRGEPLTNTR